ncbi:Protein CHROMATIN REMODELING 20 like protein [Verticillium longisporum]|uniref:Protein CHROMATIN REMODELING 20 like protein n=1 Tax=Verticillium longisporum TaxID=100787 RepID=A0A8I2Z7V8_VERLO|nr:Protein CHROMATIN REMODELING 20 like protein [Verticillium longisporum]
MPDSNDDDPYEWDVERLASELGREGRSWGSLNPAKRPDPEALTRSLRLHEVDGEILLSWEDEFQTLDTLFSDLGLKKSIHKFALKKAIAALKKRSPTYRKAQAQRAKSQTPEPTQHAEDADMHTLIPTDTMTKTAPLAATPVATAPVAATPVAATPVAATPVAATPKGSTTSPSGQPLALEPAQKKRRLAPELLSANVKGNNLPPAAAAVAANSQTHSTLYLRNNKFTTNATVHHPDLDLLTLQDSTADHASLASGFVPQLEHTQLSDESVEDELLPLFGDSGDEAEYDADTLREMEEEANEAQKPPTSLYLGREKVEAILDESVQAVVSSWTNTKLPRLQHKAHMLWNQARRNDRNRHISQAVLRVADLDRRIAKLRAEILLQDWSNPSQLRHQARCREPPKIKPLPRSHVSVMPKALDFYPDEEGDLITSEAEDSDGHNDFVVDDEMEILSTQQLVSTKEKRRGSTEVESPKSPFSAAGNPTKPTPMRSPQPKAEFTPQRSAFIDLTAADRIVTSTARRTAFGEQDVISLVTPEKPRSLGPRESDDSGPTEPPLSAQHDELDIPFDRPQDIAAVSLETWEAARDAKRLTIAFLWRRKEPWRDVIFDFLTTEHPADLWRGLILPVCKTGDLAHSGRREEGKLLVLRNLKDFAEFCYFLAQHVIPSFPRVDAQHDQPLTLAGEWSGAEEEEEEEEREASGDEDLTGNEATPSKKRRRRVIEDQGAKDNREANLQKQALDEERRLKLQQRLAASATISGDRSRLIINVSKKGDDDKDFVYVNDEIARKIKDHQIEGVRFMWNQVVAGKQGCLLAQTMGLGKTMQIITLLIAIVEASASPEPSVRAQIPERLQRSQTLVICPTGIVDNWREELTAWDNQSVLGECYTVDSKQDSVTRTSTLQEWDVRGGVLVLGYDMLRSLARADEGFKKILTDRPNIVVADEAHRLKNQRSKLAAIGSQFRTPSRIALTGSPLANNVGEFYSMIDWVAENYLGPLKEFNAYYALPIQEGLYGDSSHGEYRLAKKRLAILAKTVAPKTHRLTIKALKDELPDKVEFFLTVPLTPLQEELYDLYVRSVRENAESQADSTFAVLDNMILLNNHPRCYFRKLEKEKNMLRVPQGGDTTQDKSITPAFLTKSMKVLNRCRDLNDISLSWKVKVLVAILDECRKLREKVLIFSQSIPTIDWLSTLFRQQKRPYSRLTGDTLPSIRQSMVKNFNEGDNEIFVISTQAGGQGLNITGASRVVIFDFRFNPIAEQQAIGRAYRIGQSKPVVVYRFVSGGTYEQHLYNKAVWKMQLASRVVDKDNPKRWSTKTKDAFTRDYKAPEQKDLTEFLGRDSVLDSVLSSPAFASAIRSIIVTDTFEEEDPNDYHFDAQENQEVELMVRLEQARITDPTRYARLLAEKSAREGAQQMQALGYGHGHANLQQMQTGAPGIIHPSPHGRVVPSNGTMVGRPAPAGVTMSPGGMPYYTTYAGGGSQPASVPRANELESPFGQHGSQSHVQASVYTTARAGTAAASTTLPVMGANTFMSGQEGTTASPAQVRKSTPLQRGSPQAGSSPAVYRGTQAKELFQKQLIRSVQSSSDFDEILQAHDAEGQAKAIAEAVHEQLSGRGALPILSSWKTLNLFAQGQSFAAGVLSGLVTVEFLANTTDDGVFQQRAQELSGMDRSELKEQLLQALRRPHNVHSTSEGHGKGADTARAATTAAGPSTTPSNNSNKNYDSPVRGAAESRRKRPVKLPSWANRAVKDGQ